MQYWIRRIGDGMQAAVANAAAHGNHIKWHLPPLGADLVVWATAAIDETLRQGYVRSFKVGLSHKIAGRWSKHDDGYRALGYQQMVVLAVSDDSRVIAKAETGVIGRYRHYDPRGIVVRDAAGQVSPFALYVAFRWAPHHGRSGLPLWA